MRTVHHIDVGKRAVILRSDGQVYIAEPYSSKGPLNTGTLVATSAAGAQALGEALLEIAEKRREMKK